LFPWAVRHPRDDEFPQSEGGAASCAPLRGRRVGLPSRGLQLRKRLPWWVEQLDRITRWWNWRLPVNQRTGLLEAADGYVLRVPRSCDCADAAGFVESPQMMTSRGVYGFRHKGVVAALQGSRFLTTSSQLRPERHPNGWLQNYTRLPRSRPT